MFFIRLCFTFYSLAQLKHFAWTSQVHINHFHTQFTASVTYNIVPSHIFALKFVKKNALNLTFFRKILSLVMWVNVVSFLPQSNLSSWFSHLSNHVLLAGLSSVCSNNIQGVPELTSDCYLWCQQTVFSVTKWVANV